MTSQYIPYFEKLRFDITERTLKKIIDEETPEKAAVKIDWRVASRLSKHKDDARFVKLGERLDELRRQHEQMQIDSIEFLKQLVELAKDVRETEKLVETVAQRDQGRAALTELFEEVRNENTPIVVENIVNDIDSVVRLVRFPGWEQTPSGIKEVRKSILQIVRVKYKIKDEEVLKKTYQYVESYYVDCGEEMIDVMYSKHNRD